MGFGGWIGENWFTLLQSAGIIGGLLFTGISLRIDTKVRRVGNLFEVTKHHREIWTGLYSRPELKRILKSDVDVDRGPITSEEELFVNLLVLHLASAYRAAVGGMFILPTELDADIGRFFSLPIPRAIWEKTRRFQDQDFVGFVEDRLRG